MAIVRTNGTVWLTRAPRHIPLRRARLRSAPMFGRALGLALVGTVVAAAVSSLPPAGPARAGAPAPDLLERNPPALPAWTMFDPRPAGALPDPRLAPPPQAPPPASDWREKEFAEAAALDGLTLEAEGLRIRLSGIALPPIDEACRTLDGRIEPCATRAATHLELLTRWRKVTCRYRLTGPTDAVGECRVGPSDLGDRLVRTGYVRRVDESVGVAASASSLRRI